MKRFFSTNKLAFLIFIILFIVPSFWFNKGEVDYGGDSTRLYFYDPISWLKNIALYFVNPLSSFGLAIPNSALIPFLGFLILAKITFFHTGFELNNFFNGLLLAGGFFSVYLIVKELLNKEEGEKGINLIPIISGLFFILSPIMVPQWERALYSINQIFVYPCVFLFFLKYIKTGKGYFLAIIPVFCFIFSVNFSYGTMPWFIAFFLFSFTFLFFYSRIMGYLPRYFKGLAIFPILFFAIMSFDSLVQLYNFVNPSGLGYRMVFNKDATVNMSLPYFLSIQPHVRLVYNLLNQDQFVMTRGVDSPFWNVIYKFGIRFLPIFSIYPLIICLGMILAKKEDSKNRFKELNLFFVFFLILLFFMSANITDIGVMLYKALFHLPGFGMFRSFYSKFALSYIFFYSIFLGYCLTVIFKKISFSFTRVIMFIFLVGLIVFNGWPILSGKIPNGTLWRTDKVSFASEIDSKYEQIIDKIREEKQDFKILEVPWANESYQVLKGKGGVYFGPSSLPIFTGKNTFSGQVGFAEYWPLFQSLIDQNKFQQINKLLPILNVGYVFYDQEEYIYNNFPNYPYSDWLRDRFPDQTKIGNLVDSIGFDKLYSLGTYNFYRLKTNYLLPRFYVPENIIYSRDGVEVVSEAASMADYKIRSAFYFANMGKDSSLKENETLLNLADNYFVDGKSKNMDDFLVENLISQSGIPYPPVENLNSFQWFLTSLQERISEYKVRKNKTSLIKEKIISANKRVNAAANYEGNETHLFKIYNSKISSLIEMLRDEQDYDKRVELAYTLKYNFEDNLRKLETKRPKNYNDWNNSIEVFLEMVNQSTPKFVLDERQYLFNVPKGGKYSLFMNENNPVREAELSNSLKGCELEVNTNKIKNEVSGIDDGQISIGKVDLPLGETKLKIKFCQLTDLLASSEWKTATAGAQQSSFAGIDGFSIPPSKIIFIKDIPNWEPELWYQVSGEIRANSKIKVAIGEKRQRWIMSHKKNKLLTKYDIIKEQEISPNLNGASFKFEVKSSPKVSSAKIFLYYEGFEEDNEGKPTFEIDSVNVYQMLNPRVFLKADVAEEKNVPKILPKISFMKINPTKYRVKIKGAKDPYLLVFSEQFHSSWQIFPGQNLSTFMGDKKRGVWGLLGRFGTKTVKLFLKNADYGKVIADYFNGDINEADHQKIFLEPATFETWDKAPIAQDRHFLVNNYANSWYIIPDDVAGKEDYDLIIEFKPQRIYYLGLLISALTLIGCLIFLIGNFIKLEIFPHNEDRT